MSGRYLLDTNVAIRVLNREIDLGQRRDPGFEAFLSLTVVGELFFGAEKSARAEENRRRVDRLIEVCPVVPMDVGTARRYGELKATLRRRGGPIPENDVWIAASALRFELALVSGDRHFDGIEGLRVEDW